MAYNTNWIRSSGNMRSVKDGDFRAGIWEIQAHDESDNWYRVPFYPQSGNVCIINTNVSLSEDQEVDTLIENVPVTYNGFEIITSFDSEALAYFTLAGITDPTQKVAVNNLVKSLKFSEIWDKFYELTPILGGITGANKKLKYSVAAGNTSTLTSFVSGDYSADKGLTGNGSNKYLDPLIDMSLTGYANNNFSIGFYSQTDFAQGIPMGLSASSFYLAYGVGDLGTQVVSTVAGANQPWHGTASGLVTMTGDTGAVKTFLGDKTYDITAASSSTALTGSLQIFRFGTGQYYTGAISFYFLASKLTEDEMTVLANAVNTMQIKLGRRSATRNVFNGDSITFKIAATDEAHTWADIVNATLGGEKVNTGVSSTVFSFVSGATLGDNNGYDSFPARCIGTKPSKLFILYGLNDLRHNNASFTASLFETQLSARIDDAIAAGIDPLNITIGSPPYNDPSKFAAGALPFNGGSVMRQEDYRDACFNVAQSKGTKFADVYQDMLDNGDTSLLDTDGIHPINTGHLRIANCMLAATTV